MKQNNALLKLVNSGSRIFHGAIAAGDTVGLAQNTAQKIGADLHALIGTPGAEGDNGAQGAYVLALTDYTEKRDALRGLETVARKYCAAGMSVLKPLLGQFSGPGWSNAGFTAGVDSNPKRPLPVLMQFRVYLRANPDKEVALHSFTLTRAEELIGQLTVAYQAVDAARNVRKAAKQNRDRIQARLERRLTGTRQELAQVLSADDPRWYQFGLLRPDDGRIPFVVSGVQLRVGGAGEVIATWRRSRRAENYRVSKQVAGSPDEPEQVTFTPATEAVISGLPAATKIVVFVSAVNAAGETRTTMAEIVMP